jgi:hypothetical protein
MDLSVAPNCARCYLTFFHFPERSIAVKRLAGSPKGAEIDPNLPTLTVLLQGTRILIYIDGLFQSHQTVAKLCILPSSIFPNVQLHCKTMGYQKELKLIRTSTHKSVNPR